MWYRAVLIAPLSCLVAFQQPDTAPAKTDKAVAVSYERPPWSTLVGSTERNRYHRTQCGVAQRIRRENSIWFIDANDATQNGYVPASCNDRKCKPPSPDTSVRLGDLGGPGLPAPTPTPPQIPQPATPSTAKAKPKSEQSRPQAGGSATLAPPPRFTPDPSRAVALNQVWQGILPHRELEARWHWDVWANWALDRWCERWHVAPGGRINTDTAYSDEMEQLLLAKLKQMKEQIEDNRNRVRELRNLIEGKRKKR
jgi:hypothetical protein